MNIESISAAGTSQGAPVRDAATSAVRQSIAATARNKSPEISNTQNQPTADSQQSKSTVEDAVQRLSEFVSNTRPEISFSIDDATGTRVVKIMDRQSNDVIRQIPSEEAIQIAQALDKLQGLFVKEKA